MTVQSRHNSSTSDDVSLYGLFSLFIRNWLILGICGITFAVIAGVWAIKQPDVYTVDVMLMPTEANEDALGGLGGLGGLAAVAGVTMPDNKSDNAKLGVQLLRSKAFIAKFIEDNNMLVPLMAAKGWDIKNDKLLINENIYDEKAQKWVRKVKAPRKSQPSYLEAHKKFNDLLNVTQDPKTKFVRISLDFFSPYIAEKWANNLVTYLNNHIRTLDLNESNRSIEYLEKLVSESRVSGFKSMFSGLMEEQIKSKMLASIRSDYVFKVIDPAIAPEMKSKPRRSIIVVIAGILGGILGLIIVLYRAGRSTHKQNNQ